MIHRSTIQIPATAPTAIAVVQRPAFLDIFGLQSFRYLWASNGLSDMGEKTLSMAIAWLVLEMTGSTFWVGVVNSIPAISVLCFAVLGGVLADRTDRRLLVLRSRLALAGLTFLMGALVTSGTIGLWPIMAIMLLVGSANAIDLPTSRTMVMDVTGKSNLLSANSLNSVARNLGLIVGPTVVGALIGRWSVDAALYLLGTTYLAASLAMLRVKVGAGPQRTSPNRVLSDFKDGIGYVGRTPAVDWLIALAFTLPFAGVFFGMLPVYARDVLQVGPQGLGMMLAAFGAGALVSSASLAVRGNVRHQGLIMALSGVGFAIGMLVLAVSSSFALTLASVFFTGMAGLYWVNTTNTMAQAASSDQMRGRVMGIFMIGTQMMPLGWFIGGILATLLGSAGALAVSALIFGGAGAVVYARSREVREIR